MGKKPMRRKRLGKKAKKIAQKQANRLSGAMHHAAFSYADNRYRKGRLGKMGAASKVRHVPLSEVDLSKYESE